MTTGLSRMAINARLGDGMLSKTGKNAHITFMSTDLSLLKHKAKMLTNEGYGELRWGTQQSGYGGTKTIYNVATRVNALATEVRALSTDDILTKLDEVDLILWYLDDGSWHINQNLMHLYSNMLDERESNILADRINELYGIRPTLRLDRKKDGRQYYYLYFPRALTKVFRPKVKEYLLQYKLETMYYKFGGLDYVEKEARKLLSDETVLAVRSAIALGESSTEIQRKYRVSRNQYRGIKEGKTYKHVKEAV